MESEVDLRDRLADAATTTSSIVTSSPPPFRRDVRDFFKRHRPFTDKSRGTFKPRRMVSCTSADSALSDDAKLVVGKVGMNLTAWRKDEFSMIGKAQDASITPPSTLPAKRSENSGSSCDEQGYVQTECVTRVTDVSNAGPSHVGYQQLEADNGDQNVQSSVGDIAPQDIKMTEANQVESSTIISQEKNQVVGSSCTTTLGNLTSVSMITSTTCCSRINRDGSSHVNEYSNVNLQLVASRDAAQPHRSSSKQNSGILDNQDAFLTSNAPALETHAVEKGDALIDKQFVKADEPKNGAGGDMSVKWKENSADVTDIQSHAPSAKTSTTDLNPTCGKPEMSATDKGLPAPRKRSSNSDAFFKVNGKLYQKLGKIGTGGSSEVHKVISSDCNIYALKKIRLKGRDYATAFGFCQEILYLNKLKGRSNIIQLIDFEVTDKGLLQEVMVGSMSNEDSKVKSDGYIFMVIEYGEIDLAHMLSQKWKEIDGCDQTIDDNWLRFYWQQILLAVNTIHEERIVHSDLKPANFLLVRGSLKLIDFGIAKAIMSDTTNIQRDSQVGTLSYMSPEAFMCNETDADGNAIKCGRPSDIWSLGCILYQMVYGRTPFAEHKTFWAKFKVITDPNHEIKYPPLRNPYLLDLMQKCLAWDRDKRWRIPQLLDHPFLRPSIPPLHLRSLHNRTRSLKHLLQLVDTSTMPVKSQQLHIQKTNRSSSSPNSQSYSFTFCNN